MNSNLETMKEVAKKLGGKLVQLVKVDGKIVERVVEITKLIVLSFIAYGIGSLVGRIEEIIALIK